ncbi:hypothetical protein [Conexibacter woesei]|uniref:Uncharacterized protein n=1 Tax=Conexibacter woesei (strain DSM 14684 / CCUG 47730 / CIP 108061 / JCM 11494 / NBRC 100937 / ID131577) TaxID=469383 RepID=D3F039_CONWI|nr:hypothetical protein [Conexibacter woesei]ADB50015.1 hypothetical protein Cwoe_1587 [Conexibacter woesei DSM 14684]
MTRDRPPDPLYVEARRVLLDALDALAPHLSAVVVVGAQAVYLRVGGRSLPTMAPYTADGDLALDPALLRAAPELEVAMGGAGFRLQQIDGHVEPGIWLASARVAAQSVDIPVDLIVPDGVAPPGGRRGARLGEHGHRAARRVRGLEASLADHGPMTIGALAPGDPRKRRVAVAGPAALLIAKAHKLGERVESGRVDRLDDKDAGDVLRLMLGTAAAEVAGTVSTLAADPVAGASTAAGLRYIRELFGRRGGAGVEMAARALRLAMPAERVEAVCVSYVRELPALP